MEPPQSIKHQIDCSILVNAVTEGYILTTTLGKLDTQKVKQTRDEPLISRIELRRNHAQLQIVHILQFGNWQEEEQE